MPRHKQPKPDTRARRGAALPYQRKSDGRWCVSIELPPAFVGGPRRRKMFYGTTEHEARQRWLEWASKGRDTTPHVERGTLGAFLDHWLDDVVALRVRASSLRAYRISLAHMAPLRGLKLDPKKLTPEIIQRRVAEIARSISPDAADRALRKLRSALSYAVDTGKITSNPAAKVQGPRVERRPADPFTVAEVGAFIDAIAGHPYEAGFWLSLCGLREGEVCGAAWDDWRGATFTVRQQAARESGTVTLQSVKTGAKGVHDVALPPQAVEALERARELWRKQAVARRPAARGLIIASPRGYILHPTTYYNMFRAVLKAAGIPKRRLHDLRHTFATLAMDAGANPRAVQAQLGHTHPNTTFAYTHATPDGKAQAAQAFGARVTKKHVT